MPNVASQQTKLAVIIIAFAVISTIKEVIVLGVGAFAVFIGRRSGRPPGARRLRAPPGGAGGKSRAPAVCLSVFLLVCLPVYLIISVDPYITLSFYLSIYLSFYTSIFPSI